MKRQVVWANSVWLVLQELPERESAEKVERLDLLVSCPQMYPVRRKGRFRWHRFFRAGNWLVYYKVVDETIYVRGLWPARIP